MLFEGEFVTRREGFGRLCLEQMSEIKIEKSGFLFGLTKQSTGTVEVCCILCFKNAFLLFEFKIGESNSLFLEFIQLGTLLLSQMTSYEVFL